MAIKVSALHEKVFRARDRSQELAIAMETRSKLDNLRARPYLLIAPEELVHLDWSEEWLPDRA